MRTDAELFVQFGAQFLPSGHHNINLSSELCHTQCNLIPTLVLIGQTPSHIYAVNLVSVKVVYRIIEERGEVKYVLTRIYFLRVMCPCGLLLLLAMPYVLHLRLHRQ